MARNVFVGATRRHEGMTSVCLGLISSFQEKIGTVGFIKPVGQLDYTAGSYNLNQDSLLIDKACRIHCSLQDMSPVTVQKGYPQADLLRTKPEALEKSIRMAYDRIERNKDLVVIEGSGHAAVGSIIELSNASVAAMFGAKVILITSGASSRPLDEIVLNVAYYEKAGVEILGVIINKLVADTPEFLRLYVIDALSRKKIPLLGVIPYDPILSSPKMSQVLETLGGRLLNGATNLATRVENILVGAMSSRRALEYYMGRTWKNLLVIMGSDRTDLITTTLAATAHGPAGSSLAGLVLTGGREPDTGRMDILAQTDVPVILVDGDTYTSAVKVHTMDVKIDPADDEKIERIRQMVKNNVDTEAIWRSLGWR